MILKKKALENNVGKGENAGNQHFLLFAKSFLLQHREIAIFVTFNFLFANAFNLVASEIFSFGKELSLWKTLWKKENMLVGSIFSFSPQYCLPYERNNYYLMNSYLHMFSTWTRLEICRLVKG